MSVDPFFDKKYIKCVVYGRATNEITLEKTEATRMSEFGELNIEAMMEEDQRLSSSGKTTNNFSEQFVPMPKVEPGHTKSITVRVCPPAKGEKLYQYNRYHKINNRKVTCPRPLVNGKWDWRVKCDICEYYSALWKSVDKLEAAGAFDEAKVIKAEARSLKAVERYYYNAIVRKMVDAEGKDMLNVGPRILSVGVKVHKMIVRAFVGDESEPALGDVTHVKNGYDFIIKKEVSIGEDNFPNYDQSTFAREKSPMGTAEQIEEWQEGLKDLKKFRSVKDNEFIRKQVAIHRNLIVDDEEGFSIDALDAEYGAGSNGNGEQVASLMKDAESLGSSASVPSEIPTSEASSTPTDSELEIEDDDFFNTLENTDLED